MVMCNIVCCGEGAKVAYRSTNLCAGLEAGIGDALHAVSAQAAARNAMEFGD